MSHSPRLTYNQQWRILIVVILLVDGLLIWGSLTLAYTVRISSGLLEYSGPRNPSSYALLVAVSIPIWLLLFAIFGLYRRDLLLSGFSEYQQVIKACSAGVIAVIILSFFWRDLVLISRVWMLLSWIMSCMLLSSGRFIVRRVVGRLRYSGWYTARVIIVGANEQGVSIARQWNNSPVSGIRVVGFADDFKPIGTPVEDHLEVIGRPTRLAQLARKWNADEIILLPNAVARETFEEIIAESSTQKSYILRLSAGFFELLTTGVATTNKTYVPLFTINDSRIVGIDAVMKGIMDYGLGTFLLILLSPLMFIIAWALKIPRITLPVLSRYPTHGRGGSTFQMLKFNTRIEPERPMPQNITWFERWIYHTGLDKLPQLVNVVTGRMSLVGPRPRITGEHDDNLVTLQHLQSVKPGIIGPWIVHEYWSTTNEAQNDLYYVRNWTIWLDMQITLKSITEMVISGRNRQIVSDASVTEQDIGAFTQIDRKIAPEIKALTAKGK